MAMIKIGRDIENFMRIKAIDTFRGLSIVLMVFFTIISVLSNSLPWLLTHNIAGTLRPGDFVLPMFLFASGMSLVFFQKKREKLKRNQYFLDVIERFGKFVLIWFFLSPFSAGEFLGIDEVMLCCLLFLTTVVLIRFTDNEIIIAALLIFGVYFVLQAFGVLPDFTQHYLGGFGAAIFYLPVMLAGVLAGRNVNGTKGMVLPVLVLAGLLVVLVPPYKSIASPSFMALSVLVSLVIFDLCKQIKFEPLEYLGRTPIRYWVLMYVLIGIPIVLYASITKILLELDWPVATVSALSVMVILYAVSKIFDMIKERIQIVPG